MDFFDVYIYIYDTMTIYIESAVEIDRPIIHLEVL